MKCRFAALFLLLDSSLHPWFNGKLRLCEGITFTFIQMLTFKSLINNALVSVKL